MMCSVALPVSEARRAGASLPLIALALIAGLSGCDRGPAGPEDRGLESEALPPGLTISEPVGASGGGLLAGPTEGVFYVSASPGTFPDGVSVTISMLASPQSLTLEIQEGGFDPVGLWGLPDDELEMVVQRRDGSRIVIRTRVPRRKRPRVVRTVPVKDATEVVLNTSAVVVYSEPVQPSSVTLQSFRLLRGDEPTPGSIEILDGGLRAVFTPDEELLRATDYTIVVGTDVLDLAGDSLEAEYRASFRTASPPLTGKIVFEDRRTGNGEIYFMNPDGTGVVQVTDSVNGGFSMSPAASFDGTKIAFSVVVFGAGGGIIEDFEIYTVNVDGTGLRNVTNHAAFDGWRPAWSPDGTKIAFFSTRDDPANEEIYTIDADGTDVRRLTDHAASDANPAWSPDGSKIAFVTNRDGNFEIYVMNSDGTDPLRLTNDPTNDDWPAWSPDGTKIAFVRGGSIYLMNADGTGATALTDGGTPAWSPDGTKIAFDRGGAIYVMNADGTDVQRISGGMFPSWTP